MAIGGFFRRGLPASQADGSAQPTRGGTRHRTVHQPKGDTHDHDEVSGWKGQDVVDPSGDKIGSYTKAQVKDAPNAEPDGLLSEQEEARLYEYYGLPYSDARSDTGLPETGSGYETLTAARLVALAVMLLAGWTGGRLGERYHRRADSLVARTRPGAVGRPQRVVRAS